MPGARPHRILPLPLPWRSIPVGENTAKRRLMSTPTAAQYLDLAPSTLEKARVSGSLGLPFVKLGRRIAYDVADLDDFIERRKRRTTSDKAP
jgi:hypothetical protein